MALKHTLRLGHTVIKQLFELFPSAYEAVQGVDEWKGLGVETRYIKSIVTNCKAEKWREKAEAEFKACREAGMSFVTWFDPSFPDCLKQLPDPPSLLYVRGDVSLFNNPGVAVVGARECTPLGLNAAGRISAQLSQIGITVVSGLALGIDRQAHIGGMQGIGSSIAVLGCGLDIDYPQDNYDVRQQLYTKGLVVTEYGPGISPRANHFPIRNRIISGLSLGVLVAEAANRSGSLITARLAGEQGREVFALPGPIGQPTFTGCHRLIKQGAALVESAEDIVEALRYDFARELEGIPDPEPLEGEAGTKLEKVVIAETSAKSKDKNVQAFKGEKRSDTGPPMTQGQPKVEAESSPTELASRKRVSIVERDKIVLNEDERQVMKVLESEDKLHIDVLGRHLEWTTAKISKVLIMLEMRGAVKQLPGMWYLAREG